MTAAFDGVSADCSASPLAVVVPMFNEIAVARRCVNEISGVLSRLDSPAILVVVDDGSSDGTSQLLDELSAELPLLHVVHHPTNRGYGAGLRTGAETASALGASWLLFMDSDLTNPPSDIPRFLEATRGNADLIKGSRYMKSGAMVGVPAKRRWISQFANLFAGRLFGQPISDVTNGFRAIRTEAFLGMRLHETGFALIVEEFYQAGVAGLRCEQIPTVLRARGDDLRESAFIYSGEQIARYAQYPLRAAADRLLSAVRGVGKLSTNHRG